MKKKPSLYQRISVQDVASFMEVSYQTATKYFKKILDALGKRDRFLILKDLVRYYNLDDEDVPEFIEEFGKKVYGL